MTIKAAWGACLLLGAATASAKDVPVPLSEGDAAALRGKTVALTVHEPPSFVAFTAGKAGFGVFGVGAMVAAGNKIVNENGIEDPAILVRQQLAHALAETYGAVVLEADATPSKAKKPKDIAALHPEADYVFDVQSVGWSFMYYPTDWDNYWVGYTVLAQVVDTHDSRPIASMACGAGTKDSPLRPSRDQMLANGAELLKDVTQNLGWTCTHLLAKEQFRLPEGRIAEVPERYRDPLARLAPTAVAAHADAAPQGAAPEQANSGEAHDGQATETSSGVPAPEHIQ